MTWQEEVRWLQAAGKHDEVVPYLDSYLAAHGVSFPEAYQVLVTMTYCDESLVEESVLRCEPSTVVDLLAEIERYYGCSNDHPGKVELRLATREDVTRITIGGYLAQATGASGAEPDEAASMVLAFSGRKLLRNAHELLHNLWTKAAGAPNYDKKQWLALERLLQ